MSSEVYVPPLKPSYKNLTRNFGSIPEQPNKLLKSMSRPHVDAFNGVVNGGLNGALASIPPFQFALPNGTRIGVQVLGGSIASPRVPPITHGCRELRVFPLECRQAVRDYSGRLNVRIAYSVNGQVRGAVDKGMGYVPIMVMSDLCNLSGLSPEELVRRGEMENEFGGYFIVRGSEKILRMQINTRRNYPVCMLRTSYKSYGAMFTDRALQIRCVRADHSMAMNTLHFLSSGLCKLVFRYRKERFSVSPIVLIRALTSITDSDIYQLLTEPNDSDYYLNCVAGLLRDAQYRENREPLVGRSTVRAYLGSMYRNKLLSRVPDWATDEEVCVALLSDCVLVHLTNDWDKVNLMCFMIRKLYTFASGECSEESPDNPMLWEIQHGSHIYQQLIKNRVLISLYTFRSIMIKRYEKNSIDYQVDDTEVSQVLSLVPPVAPSICTFISTGSLPETPNIICSDKAGLSVVAEKISYTRYMSHFRAVHRGSFFSTMRTTAVRQMLPEAWGFICPVHTPDGAPCGLLNHMTMNCEVTASAPDVEALTATLHSMGVAPLTVPKPAPQCYSVLLDGLVIGRVPYSTAHKLVNSLRQMKCLGQVYRYLEVCLIPDRGTGGQYPALYLYSSDSRMMRPVMNLQHSGVEYIGSLEQVYLNVAVRLDEVNDQDRALYTHVELDDTCLLSSLALLVPQSDLNQSPRNMYQCQMSKQTMGTPAHNYPGCSDLKLYRLQTPHSPFFRPSHHDALGLDAFGQGTNAVVAVISYTGYDMEDAMIINKQSQERGLASAFIYKTKCVNLKNEKTSTKITCIFRRNDEDVENLSKFMDSDGIPHVGIRLEENSPMVCHYDFEENKYHLVRYMESEPAFVDSVKLLGDINGLDMLQTILIVLRVERKPSVGDKFASRAGQKGICSRLYQAEDLPWTDSGLVPDIIFNPHGFPSRMTIAMMVELMAGKGAAITGECFDATPFRFNEKDTSIDYFGTLLERAGYNYYGTETMYSGVTGTQMEARIFFGIIHYQRLRHMVSDKWQVRSTGPVDNMTRQPVKGRKRGGGVRFGEMERDGVMAHGTTLLAQDRLFNCSDKAQIYACSKCGSVLTPVVELQKTPGGAPRANAGSQGRRPVCSVCCSPRHVVSLHMPYMSLMLATQLAAMNVNIRFHIKLQ